MTATCVAAAVIYAFSASPLYKSSEQLFVGFDASGGTSEALQTAEEGGLFTEQRVQSYVDIATSSLVTGPVIRTLRLHISPNALASSISVSAPANTVLLDLAVTNRSPHTAERIAHAVGARLITLIGSLESTASGTPSPVRVSVSRPASVPSAPVSPRKGIIIAVSVVIGLILGVATALTLARLDTRIHSADELTALHPGFPLLGTIPEDRGVSIDPSDLLGPESAMSEPVRQLRTNIHFTNPDTALKTLLVTSPLPNEGKSTLSVAIALAMASAGTRVILLEGDMRNPTLARRARLTPGPGLTGALFSDAPVSTFLQDWPGAPDLRVLVAGNRVPSPSELLSSDKMREILLQLREESDVVVVDAPPILPVADASVLATISDGVALVSRMGVSKRTDLARALSTLERVDASIVGFIANRVSMRDLKGYGYGDYGYGDKQVAGAASDSATDTEYAS